MIVISVHLRHSLGQNMGKITGESRKFFLSLVTLQQCQRRYSLNYITLGGFRKRDSSLEAADRFAKSCRV
jgi:hypothetical protein